MSEILKEKKTEVSEAKKADNTTAASDAPKTGGTTDSANTTAISSAAKDGSTTAISNTSQSGSALESKKSKKLRKAKASDDYVPGKKKGFVKWIVLAVIVAIVGLTIFRNIMAKNAPTTVTTDHAMRGDIEVIVSISGNVASDEKKSYFADVSAPVEKLSLTKGDRVAKGDILFAYNESDLETAKKQAELNLQQAEGNYDSSIEKNRKSTDILKGNSIHDINTRLDQITDEVDALSDKIEEKTSRMNRTLTDLQKVSQDVDENGVSDTYDALQNNNAPNDRTAEDGTQMALEISQAISDVQYAIQNDPEIKQWNDEIRALNEEKADLSSQSSAELAKMTAGDKSALDAQKELTEIQYQDTIDDIESVKDGIKADFAGVVTELQAEEGATLTKGAKVITIESTDSVRVDIQISKSDLNKIKVGQSVDVNVNGSDYEGEVTKISGNAVNNASGVPVVDAQIKIKNPDDKIILGVEANNKIHTDKAENVIVIPYEYVGTDAEGDFVYTIENGTIKRNAVTLGLTTSTDAQILEGLSEGDEIVTSDPSMLNEGMPVIVLNQ